MTVEVRGCSRYGFYKMYFDIGDEWIGGEDFTIFTLHGNEDVKFMVPSSEIADTSDYTRLANEFTRKYIDEIGVYALPCNTASKDSLTKVFISTAAAGKPIHVIQNEYDSACLNIAILLAKPIHAINRMYRDMMYDDTDADRNGAIQRYYDFRHNLLSQADVVYFAKDWRNSKVCRDDHEYAEKHKIKIIEEKWR